MKKIIVTAVIFTLLLSSANGISAQSAVVLDTLTGEILYEKEGDTPRLFASTTKIMTALVALELYEPDMQVKIKREWTGIEGSSMYLIPDETVSVRQLLYGLMLSSGNDGAVALASIHTGDMRDFVTLMNAKAIEIGADSTFFENPNGLDGVNHKTTAKDLAKITACAMENPVFREIVATKQVKIGERYFKNHNRLLDMMEDCVGVKTGFTKAAGRCLVSAVDKNGRIYVAVTLNAPSDWDDHMEMYKVYGKNSQKIDVLDKNATFALDVVGGLCDKITVLPTKGVSLSLCEGEVPRIVTKLPPFVYGGFLKGQVAGVCEVYLGDKLIEAVDLVFSEAVEAEAVKLNLLERIWNQIKQIGAKSSKR